MVALLYGVPCDDTKATLLGDENVMLANNLVDSCKSTVLLIACLAFSYDFLEVPLKVCSVFQLEGNILPKCSSLQLNTRRLPERLVSFISLCFKDGVR